MRALALLSFVVVASGCSFLDDFDSFTMPDSGGVDAGPPPDSGGVDSGGVDGGGSCHAPTMLCAVMGGMVCIDVTSSRTDCGSCGHACGAGQACVTSTCVADPVVQLAAGASHACALHASGQVQCWGLNTAGQLGTGATGTGADTPQDVVGLPEPAVEIAAGHAHTCARSASGHVYCWGQNYRGELGNGMSMGSFDGTPTPQTVIGLAGASAISCGYDSTCAIVGSAGTARLMCWGNNSYGELGIDITDFPSVMMPHDVALSSSAIPMAIACGPYDEFTCVATTAGNIQCWGENAEEELGPGGVAGTPPAPIAGTNGTVDVHAGETRVCARNGTGALFCWGEGDNGELGRPIASTDDPNPTAVPMLASVTSYGVGRTHTCVLGVFGSVFAPRLYCFGTNASGELGIGGMTSMSFDMPQAVDTTGTFVEVVAGEDFSCARRNDVTTGAVVCWGRNISGECGSGDSSASDPRHLSPVPVVGL